MRIKFKTTYNRVKESLIGKVETSEVDVKNSLDHLLLSKLRKSASVKWLSNSEVEIEALPNLTLESFIHEMEMNGKKVVLSRQLIVEVK